MKKINNKPNIIYVFADQLAYNRIGYNKDRFAYTPNIDKFAKESMVLDNCISNHPVCAPYRASLFTGKYTTSTGMVINEIRLSKNHISLADVLNKNGYNTSYFGKWHLYANVFNDHYNPESSFIPEGHRLGFKEFEGYNFHHRYYAPFAYYHKDSKEKIYAKGYEPDDQFNIAIDKLKKLSKEDKPFAFFLSVGTPHDPWTVDNVPKEYYEKFKDVDIPLPPNYKKHNDRYADPWAKFIPFLRKRKDIKSWLKVYYAMVANLDYNFNKLLVEIKKLGLDKNSIIIFTSDHGEMFGSHGRRAKNIFYEESCRVPFIIYYKDKLKAIKNDVIFSSVDIMPTLLSLLNIDIPKTVEGEDKSKYLLSPNSKEDEFNGSLLMGTGITAIWGNGYEYRAYRTKRYTYAIYKRHNKELLFDNINDPYQLNNLVKDPKYLDIKNKLKEKMYLKMKEIGDDFEKNSFYKKYWVKDRVINDYLPRRNELKNK